MAKLVKLADIAKVVGVSSVTVSKALADKTGVSEELRGRIKKVAADMGYKTTLSKYETEGTGNIGVLIPKRFLSHHASFYWVLYQNVVTRAKEKGYYCILEILEHENEKNMRIPQIITNGKVDGLLVIGQPSTDYTEFIWNCSSIPIVFLDFYDSNVDYDTVVSDGFYGMYKLVNYLIQMGHNNIAFVGTPFSTSSITDRYFGYCKAMLEHGLNIREDWIIPDDRDNKSDGKIKFKLPKNIPTAFACNSDNIASILANNLKEKGLEVPEDISIVGYEDYMTDESSSLTFTTYSAGMEKMSETGVKTLIRKINKEDYIKGTQIVTGSLIIKDSVKNIN